MGRKQRPQPLSGWSMMWIICMFDIPVKTKIQMRKATRFRTQLLDNLNGPQKTNDSILSEIN